MDTHAYLDDLEPDKVVAAVPTVGPAVAAVAAVLRNAVACAPQWAPLEIEVRYGTWSGSGFTPGDSVPDSPVVSEMYNVLCDWAKAGSVAEPPCWTQQIDRFYVVAETRSTVRSSIIGNRTWDDEASTWVVHPSKVEHVTKVPLCQTDVRWEGSNVAFRVTAAAELHVPSTDSLLVRVDNVHLVRLKQRKRFLLNDAAGPAMAADVTLVIQAKTHAEVAKAMEAGMVTRTELELEMLDPRAALLASSPEHVAAKLLLTMAQITRGPPYPGCSLVVLTPPKGDAMETRKPPSGT